MRSKCLALLVILLAVITQANAQELVLATYQYSTNNRLANIQPLATHLENLLGRKMVTRSYPSVHAFLAGIRNNEVDIALINTFGYLLLDASPGGYPMKPELVLEVKAGTADNYRTAIVARNDFPANSLQELPRYAATSRIILVDPGSTSGNLVPRLALSSVGLNQPEKEFRTLVYGGNHHATMDSIGSGTVDLGAMGSTEYFNYIREPANASRVKIIWHSPEIPLGPVLVNNRLSQALKDSVLTVLLDLHRSNKQALEAVKKGWSEAGNAMKYIRMKKDYYLPFRKELGTDESIREILEQFAR